MTASAGALSITIRNEHHSQMLI